MDGDEANAKLYRERAGKLREIAEAMHDSKSRQILLQLADEYDHIAATCDAIAANDRKRAERNSK
jgi:hypothetical protein